MQTDGIKVHLSSPIRSPIALPVVRPRYHLTPSESPQRISHAKDFKTPNMAELRRMTGFAVLCECIPRNHDDELNTVVEGLYATYGEARAQVAQHFLRLTSMKRLEEHHMNPYGDKFSVEVQKGDTITVWVSLLSDSASGSTSLAPYRKKFRPGKLAAFAVVRRVSDEDGEDPTTELRSLWTSREDARREIKLDLRRQFGIASFLRYRDVEEDEVTATVKGKGDKTYYRVFIQELRGKAALTLPPTTNPSLLSPPLPKPIKTSRASLPPPKTVYTIVHHEQLRSNDPLVPGITKTKCLDEAYESLLDANQAAREYVIREVIVADEPEGVMESERAKREWLDGYVIAKGEEKNRDSEDSPYSVCIAGSGPDVEDITIEVKPLDFMSPRRRLQQDAASSSSARRTSQGNAAITRPAPSGEPGPSSVKRRRTDSGKGFPDSY
jgi:hypothetical protein